MEPLSQAILGVMGQGLIEDKKQDTRKIKGWLLGVLGGIAPDIDYLIRIDSDPLFTIEYHRQFTHSLFFIPFGSLLICFVLKLFKIKVKDSYPFVFLGYATHGLLDAFTNYGTQLWWPFSKARVAWNCVAVVDPLLTIPLLILTILFIRSGKKLFNWICWSYLVLYLSFGAFQKIRVRKVLEDNNGLTSKNSRVMIKPTIANNFIWRVIEDDGEQLHFSAVRLSLFGENIFYPGESVVKVKPDQVKVLLGENKIQIYDYERFKYFTDDYLFWLDDKSIADGRYSLLPFAKDPIWHIEFSPQGLSSHVSYVTKRRPSELDKQLLKKVWLGQKLE
ncbi:metal-dependent hydrolase [Bacteriovorax sp. Seq25_V]|uniref:metal-dependent hydrolase n=1 Tax=Bacteriovorax sp. Seq25_V TaxID=1201288 RepID=UPI00038A0F59|nr:metal-dependent hydrolase [Bacteriovorax sp. Seq25_V]EQC43734.1 putative membrane-bound metal-dependent hydrolase [Bacteriovorax sp. Seq25_V]